MAGLLAWPAQMKKTSGSLVFFCRRLKPEQGSHVRGLVVLAFTLVAYAFTLFFTPVGQRQFPHS